MLLTAAPADTPCPLELSTELEHDTLLQNLNIQVFEQPYAVKNNHLPAALSF